MFLTGFIYFPPECRLEFQRTVPTLSKSVVFSCARYSTRCFPTHKLPSNISQHTQVARTHKKLVSTNYFHETWHNISMQLVLWLSTIRKTNFKHRNLFYWNSFNAFSLFLWGNQNHHFHATVISFFLNETDCKKPVASFFAALLCNMEAIHH